VDMSRLPTPGAQGPHFAMGGDAYEADRRTGERMVADEVRWLGAKARELLEEYAREPREHRLRTFADVERVWASAVEPALPSFKTMAGAWGGEEVPEGSVWRENWRVRRGA
jgi:hypothetical protein